MAFATGLVESRFHWTWPDLSITHINGKYWALKAIKVSRAAYPFRHVMLCFLRNPEVCSISSAGSGVRLMNSTPSGANCLWSRTTSDASLWQCGQVLNHACTTITLPSNSCGCGASPLSQPSAEIFGAVLPGDSPPVSGVDIFSQRINPATITKGGPTSLKNLPAAELL